MSKNKFNYFKKMIPPPFQLNILVDSSFITSFNYDIVSCIEYKSNI